MFESFSDSSKKYFFVFCKCKVCGTLPPLQCTTDICGTLIRTIIIEELRVCITELLKKSFHEELCLFNDLTHGKINK